MLNMLIRTCVMYFSLVLGVRLLGKRQIGQLEPSELVVTMLVADISTLPLQDPSRSILDGLLPLAAVLGLEYAMSLMCLGSLGLRRLLCGKPVLLIRNGRLCQRSLRRCRITLDELTEHLRRKDVLDISTVQYAILETDGSLSVFPYPETGQLQLPVTIIGDGRLNRENLRLCGRDRAWLEGFLAERNTDIRGTYLLTLDSAGKTVFIARE